MSTQQTFADSNGSSSNWAALANGDLAMRDSLLADNLNLVHHVALQLMRSMATEIEFDEIVSIGTLGLMSAINAFDASRGLAFSTYAVPRIRGAILDELRRQDCVPRSVRRKTRAIRRIEETLMHQLGRQPEQKEIAAELGLDLMTLWRWRSELEGAVHVPLDHTTGDHDSTLPTPAEYLTGENAEGADEALNREQERIILLRAMKEELNPQEHSVISLYFFEDLGLIEIAEIFGISESRVSQIRALAISRLKRALAPILIDSGNELSQVDVAWEELNKSGALDEEDDLDALMRYDE